MTTKTQTTQLLPSTGFRKIVAGGSLIIGLTLIVGIAPAQTIICPPNAPANMKLAAMKDEILTLNIIALAQEPMKSVVVHVRPLGKGDWQTIPATHIARAVFEAKLPVAEDDLEYYVTAAGKLIWPATAPQINQTIVTMENN